MLEEPPCEKDQACISQRKGAGLQQQLEQELVGPFEVCLPKKKTCRKHSVIAELTFTSKLLRCHPQGTQRPQAGFRVDKKSWLRGVRSGLTGQGKEQGKEMTPSEDSLLRSGAHIFGTKSGGEVGKSTLHCWTNVG